MLIDRVSTPGEGQIKVGTRPRAFLFMGCSAAFGVREGGRAPHILANGRSGATWPSLQNGKPPMRGVERLRAWCEGLSLRSPAQ